MTKKNSGYLLGGRELAVMAGFLGFLVMACAAYVFWLPDVSEFKKKNPADTSFMRLKERQARARGLKLTRRMAWTPWAAISENLKHAVLVAEDGGFYSHNGVDWDSTREALKTDWKKKRFAKGGSTITQQVARNLYLSPSKNPLRKVKEILIARRLERELGKRRIFEIYLNIAEWGKGIYGAQAAAEAYFGKNAADLTPEESAALAAALPSPRRYNPTGGTRFMERQKSRIVARMRASGYLPEESEDEVLEESFGVISSTGIAVSTYAVSD
ncbi:MAG: monofunctional biosynthetic peptidoglycan transglycosylase [Elusimicrobia bacterium GWC2_61_19]|nr:MAG: monofunctional biosynthetic peptidoglycan transglycosylase [Elusimicrobia bacterium GWC2_61_19]